MAADVFCFVLFLFLFELLTNVCFFFVVVLGNQPSFYPCTDLVSLFILLFAVQGIPPI